MTHINEKKLDLVWRMMDNLTTRKIIIELYKKPNKTQTHSELSKIIERISPLERKTRSSRCAYHIRRLKNTGVIKNDDRYYFLTRIGLECGKVINTFEKNCMEYDLTECDKDGKIAIIINRVERTKK